jgi:hypothetical protein
MVTSNVGDSSTDSPDGLFSGNTSRASPSPADSIKLKQMAAVLRSKIMDTMQGIKQAQEKKEGELCSDFDRRKMGLMSTAGGLLVHVDYLSMFSYDSLPDPMITLC